jgi:hypothetical protein
MAYRTYRVKVGQGYKDVVEAAGTSAGVEQVEVNLDLAEVTDAKYAILALEAVIKYLRAQRKFPPV